MNTNTAPKVINNSSNSNANLIDVTEPPVDTSSATSKAPRDPLKELEGIWFVHNAFWYL